jgi:Tfp pilus assembly protein FimT
MKLPTAISKTRRAAGIMLIECLVYIAVFAILTGIGFAAFYLCWDHSKALIYATDDIGSALRAGERWRADVRGATGKISIESTAAGDVVRIPESEKEIIYRFDSGEVRREISTLKNSQLLLQKVNTSQMRTEERAGVTAWRWELVLNERRPETQLPLLFTFEAAQTKP